MATANCLYRCLIGPQNCCQGRYFTFMKDGNFDKNKDEKNLSYVIQNYKSFSWNFQLCSAVTLLSCTEQNVENCTNLINGKGKYFSREKMHNFSNKWNEVVEYNSRRRKCIILRINADLNGQSASLYIYICGLRMCADSKTPFYLYVSGLLAGGVLGKRDLHSPPWQLIRWRLGRKDMLMSLAPAGPAGDFKNTLLSSSLGRYVAYCVWP